MAQSLIPVFLLASAGALAQPAVNPVRTADMHPGYGTVESISPVRLVARERSAAAGGSTAKSALEGRPAYRVSVRMADGSMQQRDVDNLEVKVGQDVLLTNAGDVLPDNPPTQGDAPRGNVPPGRSRDGSAPAEGAIKGGAAAGGSSPKAAERADKLQRCNELSGSLREQCLEKERSAPGARP